MSLSRQDFTHGCKYLVSLFCKQRKLESLPPCSFQIKLKGEKENKRINIKKHHLHKDFKARLPLSCLEGYAQCPVIPNFQSIYTTMRKEEEISCKILSFATLRKPTSSAVSSQQFISCWEKKIIELEELLLTPRFSFGLRKIPQMAANLHRVCVLVALESHKKWKQRLQLHSN